MNFIQKFKKKGQSFLSFGIKKKNIRFFCAFLAGSLSVCAYPPAYHTSALFFSFSALVYLINEAESKTEAFFSGGLFGGGLSLTSLFYAVTGLYESYSLPVYLFFMSVFFLFCFSFTAIPALLACSYPKGIRRFLAFCVLAALSEWVRTYIFNGSWNLSATVLTKYPSLMRGCKKAEIIFLRLYNRKSCVKRLKYGASTLDLSLVYLYCGNAEVS